RARATRRPSSSRRSSPRPAPRTSSSADPAAPSPRRRSRATVRAMAIEHVFVAGAGLMGHGIGQVHAAIGRDVLLYEPDLARAEAGKARIAANLDRAVAKGKLTAEEREAILA